MKIIKLLLQSSKGLFAIAAISSVFTGVCSSFLIKMIHESVQATDFDSSSFMLVFGMYWIGYGVLAVVSSFTVSKLSQGIIHKLRMQLSDKILNAEYQSIETNQQKIFPILTEDIKTISNGIDRLPSVTTGLATVIGILSYMVWYSPILTLSVIGLFAIVFIITKLSLPLTRKYQEKSRILWNDIFKLFEGLVYGIKELSLNKDFKKSYLNDVIEPTSRKQNSYMIKESVVVAVTSKSGDMVLLLGMAALIVVIFKTGFVEAQVFGNYLTLVLFTIAPLSTVTGWFSNMKRIEVALEQIAIIGVDLEETKASEDIKLLASSNVNAPIVELKGVKHEYYNPDEDEHFELGPIDLKIEQGELIFLLGGKGSGKTTLAKILLGLYAAKDGKIFFQGEEVLDGFKEDFRSKFSATFVDSYLFENLTHLGEENILARGQELLKTLELTKKVKIENMKFSTLRLSEGQKKRLGLLNAILEDKEIYLFDEWAANQDPHFKKIFYEIILQDLKKAGKTIIVISHDEQYFESGDRVIKLMEGKLV
jgi:putative ATP-binding cassette transporter